MKTTQRPHISKQKKRRSKATTVFAIQALPNQSYRFSAVQHQNEHIQSVQRIDFVTSANATEAIRELDYRRGADAILTIPRHMAIVKSIRVPTVNSRQIDQMILHEIRPIMPWSEEDGIWGYTIEHLSEDGYANLLVVMVRKDLLLQHYDQLKSMGIELTHITLSMLALQSLLECVDDDERPAMLHVGDGTAEYIRLSHNRIAFTRGVNSGAAPLTVFQQSVELDNRNNGAESNYTSLITINETDGSSDSILPDNPEVAVAHAQDVDFGPLLDPTQFSDSDILCAGASLRLMTSSVTENLLPDTAQKSLGLRHLLQSAKWFTFSLAWLVCVVFAVGWLDVYTQRAIIESTRAEIQQLKGEVGDLDVQSRELSQLSSEYASISDSLALLLELYELTPNKIAINYFRYTDAGAMVIGGEAPAMEDVIAYIGTLQASNSFTNVSSNNISKPNGGTSSLAEFKLTCTVSSQ